MTFNIQIQDPSNGEIFDIQLNGAFYAASRHLKVDKKEDAICIVAGQTVIGTNTNNEPSTWYKSEIINWESL